MQRMNRLISEQYLHKSFLFILLSILVSFVYAFRLARFGKWYVRNK